MSAKALMEKRAALIKQARELNDRVSKDNRDFNAEEQKQYDALFTDAETLNKRAAREAQLAEEERKLGESRGTVAGQADSETRGAPAGDADPVAKAKAESRAALRKFFRSGERSLNADEHRALQVDSDASGGYIVPPQDFVADLIQAVDNLVLIRQWAKKYTVARAQSLGIPSLDANPADAIWTSELGTGDEDSTMAFGKRELTPHPLAKRIKVSNKLIDSSPLNVEELVRDRLAYKIAVPEESGFMTGNGSGQPLGVFTASANGISTGRDVSTDNSTTAMTVDGLINAKYALKPPYWANAKWVFHTDGVKQIAKLKDGNGQYLWKENVRVGEPATLLGFPVYASEYAPNTFTTGLYVGMLGDFSKYYIADALSPKIQRLVELYAATNQVGFIIRAEVDGMPAIEEAFVRVKLA